jgi:hypothetical protein
MGKLLERVVQFAAENPGPDEPVHQVLLEAEVCVSAAVTFRPCILVRLDVGVTLPPPFLKIIPVERA